MLRIKESTWQKFCDNAEQLGFKKKVKYYSDKYISICLKTHYYLVNNVGYSPYGDFMITNTMYNSYRFYIGNSIFNLIQ